MSPGPGATIVFDLDGTLCSNTFGAYERAEPFQWAVDRVNSLASAGHRIVLFTARGSATGIDWDARTREQLAGWGVRYDELRFGKPSGDVYVDDRAIHTDAWRLGDEFSAPAFPLSEANGLPAAHSAELTAVTEIGRTYGGRPLRLAEHAARAHRLACSAGMIEPPPTEALSEAVSAVLAEAPAAAGDDLVYAITIAGVAHAAFLDVSNADPHSHHQQWTTRIIRRRLSQSVAALRPLLALQGPKGTLTVPVVTDSGGGSPSFASGWPLAVREDGVVCDPLGGELAIFGDRRLVISDEQRGDITSGWLAEIAAEMGHEVVRAPVAVDQLRGCDEAALVGSPFCLLPIGSVDGSPVGDAPGPLTQALHVAWSQAAGIDLGAQVAALSR